MSHKLINFHIPTGLKASLDAISKAKRLSRTAIINQLLENYCRTETALMEAPRGPKVSDGFLNRLDDNNLALTPRLVNRENFDGGW